MNDKLTISVKEICGDNIYTRDEGKPLYEKIKTCLIGGCSVLVDFESREIASESFLDEAIVEHYLHPVVENSKDLISLKNVSTPDQMLLQRIYVYRKRLEKDQDAQLVREIFGKPKSKTTLRPGDK